MPSPLELAELRLADAIDALYDVKDFAAASEFINARSLSLAITKAEESALWLGASRSRESLSTALRRVGGI